MGVPFKDYYGILGVRRDASEDEIRRAYRALARKHHPDLNPGDPKAEARFKEVNEANAVLSDPEKRKLYDQYGTGFAAGADFTPPGGAQGVPFDLSELFRGRGRGGGGGGGFSDFFELLFGGRGGPRPGPGFAMRGPDVEAALSLTLEEAHRGAAKSLALAAERACPECQGSGRKGEGACPSCRGRGALPEARTVEVKIAPGARPGSVLRLPGQGGAGAGSAPAGDLYLRVEIAPHPVFRPVGADDVEVTLPVSPWEAALGAQVSVPTLDGPVEMTLPAGTQGGQRMRLRGKGLATRGGARGDAYVRVNVVVPAELAPEERELFERLRAVSRFDPRGAPGGGRT